MTNEHLNTATLAEVGEKGIIAAIQEVAPSSINGDDAAVLTIGPPNTRTVVTTDMLVENRHFNLAWSTPEEVGHKAVVQNFADIQAMGARPIAVLFALSAPSTTKLSLVTGIARGIYERIQEFSAELVGGDLTAGDSIVVSLTAVGSLGGSQPPLLLNRARPGQKVIASGRIGYSAAGFDLLKKFGREDVPVEFQKLVRAHCTPPLMPDRGVVARATGATAMTDNSDGLITDLTTMAERSAVTIDLNASAIEPDHRLLRAAELLGKDPWKWVLTGGEDHTLLATTTGDNVSGFRPIGRVIRRTDSPVTIGGEKPKWVEGWGSY
ncbi:thiamine-phosphate kinase [Corynebacterium pyruviciproducens]|uniref:thiamine-phosphate kinase n=1 Tax=Corynebacterium pyruviciproducens TaxID=598660 RepID=UPI00254A9164|nr:thiamine-phosphate kinase [Corynebacterium pyruviciproducens]MDK7214793.1 thiamine-phosphate kinase [Corynebacterium pyruviciproducens]